MLDYDGRIVLAEGSWTQVGAEPIDGPVIPGTRGSVVVDYAIQHGEFGPASWRWVLKGVRMYLRGYSEWIDIELATPEPGMRSGIEHLVYAVREERAELFEPVRPGVHVKAQYVIDGCLQALRTCSRVALGAATVRT